MGRSLRPALSVATGAAATLALAAPAGTARTDPLARLPLRQLVGQRLIVGFPGPVVPAQLRRMIARGEAGGVLLFAPNISSRAALKRLAHDLQAIRRPRGLRDAPLVIALDQEGGLVKRVPGPPDHSAAELGRIGRTGLTRNEGRATGRSLRAVGVTLDLAPVMDVARPGSADERLGRSFGRRPEPVGRLGAAFVTGLRAGRVAAALKHFPGIGAVRDDQDLAAQRVREPLGRLRSFDEAPFARGIAAHADVVMLASARFPALDPLPALLSGRAIKGELRGRLGFRGVTLSDDLDAPSLRPWGGAATLAVRGARAGDDLMPFSAPASAAAAENALVAAARAGTLGSRADLEAAAARVLALRRRAR
ncbi:MAG TPA: glycoside hydrolase family 3 N-terminal domain-containing protein [Solirubrobacteraceae bacterium]